ncbi:hypothetical protein C8Q78DRAFT_1006681 [Trametes maxima]|nr:hypothetical protein C8Q78DRAFT_1006681 [Trametes maxima]
MVSILYRTHKGLPVSAKGASLYAFDALVRAARNRANKSNLPGDLNLKKGNCATFLLRIETILDGVFRDLLTIGSDELKEKAKKILDIWTKQNTFSSNVLSPLYSLLREAETAKEPDNADAANVAPTEPSAPVLPPTAQPPTLQPSSNPPVDVSAVQSTLMALLSKAASTAGTGTTFPGQIAPNNAPAPPAVPVPVLDANQLALLQQLAQTAKGNAAPSQPIPVLASVVPSLTTSNAVPVVPPVPGPPQPQPFPYRDDHYGAPAPQRESEYDRFNGSGPGRGYPRDNRDNYNEPRRETRGGPRGGPRDHGRGGRGRGRRDDRDHFRERSREFSRDPRLRRSRSPPGRYGGHGPRDGRPHNPPRRGGYGHYGPPRGYGAENDGPPRAAPEPGKDEFGRDLRPESPPNSDSASALLGNQRRSASPPPPRTGSVTTSERGSVASDNTYPAVNPGGPASGAPTNPSYPQAHGTSPPAAVSSSITTAPLSPAQQKRTVGGDGLDGFDRANFDPSQPASWEALGKAWTTTHGTPPTQEELMQFVFGGGPPAPTASPSTNEIPTSTTQQASQVSPSNQQLPSQPQRYPPPQYGSDPGQWQDQDRQWDRQPQGQRGGWRGGHGGDGGYGGSGRGRGRGRGRGDFGRGGHGRGDHGWGGGFGRGERGRGEYGYGNGRGAYSTGGRGGGGFQEQETDAVILGGGDDFEWQGEREPRGPSYGQQPAYQDQNSYQVQPTYQDQSPYQGQQPFQSQPQGAPDAYDTALSPGQPNEGGEDTGGGGSGGRMQKVGDKWVFVRNTT